MGHSTFTPTKTRLGEILENEGRRQSWLADRTGIDRGTISRYVNGLHVPKHHREPIAAALGRTVADVFPEAS